MARKVGSDQFRAAKGPTKSGRKATDILGHVGNPSPTKTIIADARPPEATINASANPVKPLLNGNGNWQVSLSGTALDPAIGNLAGSGVNPASVQVRLIGEGGIAVGDTWQAATYNANSKAWTVNYLFPARVAGRHRRLYSQRARRRPSRQHGRRQQHRRQRRDRHLAARPQRPDRMLSTGDASRQLIATPITLSGSVTVIIGFVHRRGSKPSYVEQIRAVSRPT